MVLLPLLESVRPMSKISPRVAVVLGVVVVVILIGVALIVGRGGSKPSDSDASATVPSSIDTAQTGDPTNTGAPDDASSTTLAPDSIETVPKEPVSKEIPLTVTVSNTSGLHDGDSVKVHVTPKAPGKVVYGFEMFICADGATFQLDADIRPTFTGKCIENPLSTTSGDYVKVAAAAPYTSADGTIKVGVGSNTYTTQKGNSVTITCGPGHPCQLVLKLQFQDAYGFQAYPLTFS